jgi:predicted ATP-dependent endonuclease of OLD family
MFTQAVIVIDEINSFLHPAATKSLLRIAQTRYNKHQYIISTHSPDVIGESNAATVHLVRRAGYESSIERVDLSKVDHFRDLADQLGISMTDVFGAERIVWVEDRGNLFSLCLYIVMWPTTARPDLRTFDCDR